MPYIVVECVPGMGVSDSERQKARPYETFDKALKGALTVYHEEFLPRQDRYVRNRQAGVATTIPPDRIVIVEDDGTSLGKPASPENRDALEVASNSEWRKTGRRPPIKCGFF